MMEKRYPEYHDHLRGLTAKLGKELPGVVSGFRMLYKETLADGALSTKTKELIALAAALPRAVMAASLLTFVLPSVLVPPAKRSLKRSASPS